MKISHPEKTHKIDPDKASEVLEKLLKVFKSERPNVGEIIIILSNLIYSLGSSISPIYGVEYEEKGPSVEELNKLYYSESGRIDVALMIQGIIISTWLEDWEKVKTSKDIKEKTNETSSVPNI